MAAFLSLIIQAVGFVTSIYLGFTRDIKQGLLLAIAIGLGHFAFTQLSNFLMFIHQKTLANYELDELNLRAVSGFGAEKILNVWRRISSVCGLMYFCFSSAAIWLFVTGSNPF
jgi:hypothetical protein